MRLASKEQILERPFFESWVEMDTSTRAGIPAVVADWKQDTVGEYSSRKAKSCRYCVFIHPFCSVMLLSHLETCRNLFNCYDE